MHSLTHTKDSRKQIIDKNHKYFQQTFKSSFLLDKHPVIIMKDVDFDILKCLVEYMYKGEANVPQQMLPAFIQMAESLADDRAGDLFNDLK